MGVSVDDARGWSRLVARGKTRGIHPTQRAPARHGEHAIVVGASVAGLLAARVLSEFYARVTVLDRDALPAGVGEGRRAVPQGRHIHGMQPGGQHALEELFGGFCAEALEAGAPPLAFGLEMRLRVGGHLLARVDLPGDYCLTSRDLLEGLVRRRVRGLSNVTLRDRCGVLGLVADGARVAGVRALDRTPGSREQVLHGDLVVAATGRAAKVSTWLEELGYPRAVEERVDVDIFYASRYLRLPAGVLGRDRVVLDDAHAGRPRGIAAQSVEGDRWIVTLYGYGPAHRPPTEDGGWRAFAATVADPEVIAAIEDAEPLGEIDTHGFPAGVRRRYERLKRVPDGLLVMGDAMCAFNPIYGQGMSVAALEAVALRRVLLGGERRLAKRYYRAARRPVSEAWWLAAGTDRALPELGMRVPLAERLANRYVDRLVAGAERDEVLARTVYDVTGMLAPPSRLLAPSTIPRVLFAAARRSKGRP